MPCLRLMRSNARIFASSLFAALLFAFCWLPLVAQQNQSKPPVNHAVASGVSVPLRDLAKLPPRPTYGFHEANRIRRVPKPLQQPVLDQVEQSTRTFAAVDYFLKLSVVGVGNGFPGYSVPDAPPDTNLAVGDTQLIQWVNVSYAVFDKNTGTALTDAIDGNALWASGLPGTLCANHNAGDPIVQWDRVAHRWLLAQNVFTSPYAVCVAVSTSPDALGTYYVYQFSVPGNGFPDYPKWGIWPTGYFQAQNNFGPGGSGFRGPQVCYYNSAKLLVGDQTAEQICHQYTTSEDSLLPGDLDSPTLPPAGQDEFLIGSVGDVDNSHLSMYSVHVDSQGATFTGDGNSQLVAIAPFTPACNGSYGGACVPQKDVTDKLDSLGDRLMYRFAYYNDSAAQHWYVNFDVTASAGQNGVRWMEFTAPPSLVGPTGISIFQQGTYAPDGNWRWMGSIARDQSNDVLVGYSESNNDMYPSIFVAGRTPAGVIGTLEDELSVINGTGSQPDTSNRWGDYSAMRIDPVDNCTFWYTTEYYMVTQRFDWSTQVAAVNFPRCGVQQPVVSQSAFEAWNLSGQTANEFQVFFGGVDPRDIVGTYNGDYPNVEVLGIDGGTLISWTGSVTPNDTKSHFGLSFAQNINPNPVMFTWVKDGSNIEALSSYWQFWIRGAGGGRIDVGGGRFADDSEVTSSYWQRRELTFSGDIGLNDLLRDGPLWNEAEIIDPNFILVDPRIPGPLFIYQSPPEDWSVMMYDMLDSNHRLIMTFGNAFKPLP